MSLCAHRVHIEARDLFESKYKWFNHLKISWYSLATTTTLPSREHLHTIDRMGADARWPSNCVECAPVASHERSIIIDLNDLSSCGRCRTAPIGGDRMGTPNTPWDILFDAVRRRRGRRSACAKKTRRIGAVAGGVSIDVACGSQPVRQPIHACIQSAIHTM